jgi:hypothetical protein
MEKRLRNGWFKNRNCMNKPTLKAIHISSRISQRATKTVKEYVLPTHTLELNNKRQKTKQNVEALCTTKYIAHS